LEHHVGEVSGSYLAPLSKLRAIAAAHKALASTGWTRAHSSQPWRTDQIIIWRNPI